MISREALRAAMREGFVKGMLVVGLEFGVMVEVLFGRRGLKGTSPPPPYALFW
jgi:hypothetical protein